MNKFVTLSAITAAAIALASCGQVQSANARFVGYTKVCVDGVTYLQFPTGTTVQRSADDKLVPC